MSGACTIVTSSVFPCLFILNAKVVHYEDSFKMPSDSIILWMLLKKIGNVLLCFFFCGNNKNSFW